MTLSEIVASERRTGFARFAGTQAAIGVPIRQRVIDEVLPLIPGVPQGLRVDLLEDQRMRVQVGAFQATAYLHPAVQLRPTPLVRLELASQLVAFGLRRLSLPAFVQVAGREVQIDLGAIPALAEVADVWPLIERITITSGERAWEIVVQLNVVATGAPAAPPQVTRASGIGARQAPAALVDWARRQWTSGLPALAGARATAHVRASVVVLNEWLGGVLRQLASGERTMRAESPTPDLSRVVGLVRHLRVDAAPGVITLDVEAGVDG